MTPVRLARRLAGLSQREAADLLGDSLPDYRALEELPGPAPEPLVRAIDWPHVRAVLGVDPADDASFAGVLDCHGMATARILLDLTVPRFAERIGAPYGTVAAWMRCQQDPYLRTRRVVAGVVHDAVLLASGRGQHAATVRSVSEAVAMMPPH